MCVVGERDGDGQGSAPEQNEIRWVGNVPMGTALPDKFSGRYGYYFVNTQKKLGNGYGYGYIWVSIFPSLLIVNH
jgi:hypothetical protein